MLIRVFIQNLNTSNLWILDYIWWKQGKDCLHSVLLRKKKKRLQVNKEEKRFKRKKKITRLLDSVKQAAHPMLETSDKPGDIPGVSVTVAWSYLWHGHVPLWRDRRPDVSMGKNSSSPRRLKEHMCLWGAISLTRPRHPLCCRWCNRPYWRGECHTPHLHLQSTG